VTWRLWSIAAIALLAACGGDDSVSPASVSSHSDSSSAVSPPATSIVAIATTSTTLPVSTTVRDPQVSAATTRAVPTTSVAGCAEPPAFDPDAPLRDQFVGYLVGCGFTEPEAACLFDQLDFDDPAVLAGEPDAMAPAFEACGIDVGRMAEIGGGT
jgi:hypothetical protein